MLSFLGRAFKTSQTLSANYLLWASQELYMGLKSDHCLPLICLFHPFASGIFRLFSYPQCLSIPQSIASLLFISCCVCPSTTRFQEAVFFVLKHFLKEHVSKLSCASPPPNSLPSLRCCFFVYFFTLPDNSPLLPPSAPP